MMTYTCSLIFMIGLIVLISYLGSLLLTKLQERLLVKILSITKHHPMAEIWTLSTKSKKYMD